LIKLPKFDFISIESMFFLGISMLKSTKNNWGAPSLKEKFEEKLDDAKLFQFLKII